MILKICNKKNRLQELFFIIYIKYYLLYNEIIVYINVKFLYIKLLIKVLYSLVYEKINVNYIFF